MKLQFVNQMCLDTGDGGTMIFRNEEHKLTMTIFTPKTKGQEHDIYGDYGTPIKTFRFDGDDKEYTGQQVVEILKEKGVAP